ncbi:VPA1267 family protein [Ruegeria sp. 2012CJ41-6]|uniref:VPA1267 family protein n=1 Tax=Ruegeria spongiae TaxID=2942209 RepID=A0ABT0Q376_9RHOB|nr:VPA1267 family protein [Ruegeria spongiae]MCL6284268.1 VPA1267 family protein [Ruegeria spongiae]
MKQESVDRFNAWIAERKAKEDWSEYIRRGQLNRSEISTECGFARSAFSTNDLLKSALAKAEKKLIAEDILAPVSASTGSSDQQEKRAPVGPDPRDQEIKRLRERVSTLAAENAELKAQLKSRNTILDEIIPRGRRVNLGEQP